MSHINEKNGNTKFKNGKLEYGGPLDPAASEVSAFFDDIFLYVFYFFSSLSS